MSLERMFPVPPTTERVDVVRVAVDETCPQCGSTNVARYPVANYIGPRMVTKCQACFHKLAVDIPEPDDLWPPWEAPTADWLGSRAG